MPAAGPSPPQRRSGIPRGAWYVLAVMVGINLLNYMDRWVLSAVAVPVEKEFHFGDTTLGLVGSAFTLVYALGTLPFGVWADRGVRKVVIGTGVAIWSVATVLTGFARNFGQLFASRALVGIGEASYYPAGTSLLGDYFPRAWRARAMSIWGAGTAVGIAIGFAGGGIIGARFGWRAAFFLTAIPGVAFAILAFAMREPLRGAAEARGRQLERAEHATLKHLGTLFRIPSLRASILSQTLLFFVLGANAFWLPTALHRRYGLGIAAAGTVAGGVIVLGGLIGTLAGGVVADRRRRRTPRANLEVGIAGFVVGAVCITVGLLSPSYPLFIAAFLVSVVCIYLYSGPFTALSQDVVVPSLRASATTLSLLVAHLFGDSYATYVVGALSDALHSLQLALLIVSPTLLILAAVVAAFGLRHLGPDMEAADSAWAAATEESLSLLPGSL